MKDKTQIIIWQEGEETERTFVIKKFPALKSINILKKLLTATLPIDLLSMLDTDGALGNQLALPQRNTQMSDDEFTELCKDILRAAYEKLPAEDVRIIDEVGNYRVSDIEYDLDLHVWLLIKILLFNFKDFFIGGLPKLSKQMGA